MHISDKHLEIVTNILNDIVPSYEVWAFGSRVHGKHLKQFSDLDIVIIDSEQTRVPLKKIIQLKLAFSDSDLPYFVDIVLWSELKDDFKQIIEQQYHLLQISK